MADRMSAWIEIGGPIRARQIDGLLEAIEQDGAREDWGGEPVTNLNPDGASTLKLFDEDAPWGQFQAVEAFCQRHGIAFERHCEGKYEFDSHTLLFRPGHEAVYRPTIASTGEPVVLREEIVAARAKLQSRDLDSALALLEQALGPDVPALTPLVRIPPRHSSKKLER